MTAKKKSGQKRPAKLSKAPQKRPGATSKYDPDHHPFMAWALAIRGKTNKEIAAGLRISTGTLFTWGKEHPEFLSSLKAGKDSADTKVESSLFMRAFGYEYEEVKTEEGPDGTKITRTVKAVPPDTTAMIFWLKNRRPKEWRDKHELTGDAGGPLVVKVLKGVSMEDL
jgi:hypothetical protein